MSVEIIPIAQAVRSTDPQRKTPWRFNAASDDASGCEVIVPSPGVGFALHVERLLISITAAVTVTIGEGKDSGGLSRTLIGSLGGAAGTFCPIDFGETPMRLNENNALCMDASGAGKVSVIVEGWTEAESRSESPSTSISASASSSVSASPSSSASA